jgi:hypothetical protein
MLQLSGAAILWRSELQSTTARSVFESELIALYVGTADIIWMSGLYEFYTGSALNIPTYIRWASSVARLGKRVRLSGSAAVLRFVAV